MDPLPYLKRVEPNTFEPLVRFHYHFQVDLLIDFLNSLAVLGLLEKPACYQEGWRLKLTWAKQKPE